MKTIIAATDFSPAALNAVHYAADMALSLEAELLLFNAYNVPVVYNDGAVITTAVEELQENSEKELLKVRDSILQRTAGKIRLSIKSRLGNVTEELEDMCKSLQPFIVVIGTKGKTNYEQALFGSSALSMIKHLTSPVLCIPPTKEFGNGIKKICFACDFREVSDTIPEAAIRDVIRTFRAELHILNVDYKEKRFRTGGPEETFALHQMFLKDRPYYHFIESPDIEAGINEFAQSQKMDLIMMVPKRHTMLAKLFKPSHTRKLIMKSTFPVLCIHQ